MEEATQPSWSTPLGEFHLAMNTMLTFLFGLRDATGMETLITLLVVFLAFYFGLMYVAKKFKADPDRRDIGAFVNNISISFGILSVIIELLIVLLSYGSVPLFLWSIAIVSCAVAVVVLIRLAFVEFKAKLKWINGRLMEYFKRFYGCCVAPVIERILSDRSKEQQAQDQNQNQNQNQNEMMIELNLV